VKPRHDPSLDLLTLAAEQGGVLTLEQAVGLGFNRHSVARMLEQGHWTRVARGIVWTHRLGAQQEPPWLAREGAESPLELTYLRDVERPHGLPRGRRQKSRLGLRYVSDVGYDEWALLLELDGRDGHAEEGRFRDRRRDNAFALRALLTLRYGWYDVTDKPCAVAWQVATVLRARGWLGDFRRCGRCRALSDVDFAALA
jgi:hypothetical protein